MNLCTNNGCYQIHKIVGESGKSIVFEAHDPHRSQKIALKLMKKNITSSYMEDLIRFKREIQIMSKLSHPHVIKIYGEGEFESQPFIIMELLEGSVLSEIVKSPGQLSVEAATDIIKQVALALKYVHSNGIIHRDIKPGNIFIEQVEAQMRVKLLDFGVAWLVELGGIQEPDEIAGTFGYMAPETTGMLDKRIDERSDLYSLGVVFYQLLTGKTPFNGNKVSQLLHQQVAKNPCPPRTINCKIPPVIEQMVLKLLNKDPDQRYQSANGLIYDLQRFQNGESTFEVGYNDQKLRIFYQTYLIGRDTQTQKLRALFEEAKRGAGSLCLIAGEAGSGKSRLVEELRGFVFEKDGIFLRGRCLNYANKFPFQPFKGVIDEYINQMMTYEEPRLNEEKQRLKGALGDLSGIVNKLNPRMESFLGTTKEVVPLEPERENQRFLMTLTEFFCNLASPQCSCVLFLDDLQWADESSLVLLEELVKKVKKSRLLIIGTYRDNEVEPTSPLHKMITLSQNSRFNLELIQLKPFTPVDVYALVKCLFGGEVDYMEYLSNYICGKTGGNPFFAINIVREFVEKRILFWQEGRWKYEPQNIQDVPIPSTLLEIILRRIDGLSDAETELLTKAAVIGREFQIELLYRLTPLTSMEIVDMIDEFIGLQLLEPSLRNGRITFVHDRIRDAFYNTLSDLERQKIHLLTACAIEGMNQSAPNEVVYELAHHFLESGNQEKALDYLIPAAQKAQHSYAFVEAIRFYQKALLILADLQRQDLEPWFTIKVELGRVYLVTGKNDEAIQIVQTILPLAESRLVTARLHHMIGAAYFKKGDWSECEKSFNAGLKLLGERVPKTKVMTYLLSAKELVGYFIYDVALKYFMPAKGRQRDEDTISEIAAMYFAVGRMYILNDSAKMFCCLMRLMNLTHANRLKTKELAICITGVAAVCMAVPFFKMAVKKHQEALRIRQEINDEWGEAINLQYLGYTYSWMGNHVASMAGFEASVQKFKKIGDHWELAMAYNGLGLEYYFIANYEKALSYLTQFVSLSQETRDSYGYICGSVNIVRCYNETGEFQKGLALLDEVEEESKGNPFLYFLVKMLQGIIELYGCNYQKAFTFFEAAVEIDRRNIFLKHYSSQIYPHLAEAYLGMMRAKGVPSRISWHQSRQVARYCQLALRKTKNWPHYHGLSLLICAKYHDWVGNPKKANLFFLKSIQANQKIDRPFELGRSYLEYGLFLKAQQREEWRNKIKEAADIFKLINSGFFFQKSLDVLKSETENSPEPGFAEDHAQKRLKNARRMDAFLTASSYLSSILELDQLLEKMMDIAIELVGAEKGALFLSQDQKVQNINDFEVKLLRNISKDEIAEGFHPSLSIISKVVTDQKPVIVSDASTAPEFKMQSSIVIRGIRSVLGVPIMLHERIMGILYLENNLVSGLFREEDVKVLNLLMIQAGIYIENARLYSHLFKLNQELEQRVSERTEELYCKNDELEAINAQLNQKNQELVGLYQQLQEHAATIEELAVVKERNRLAREVHDTLGHTLTLVILLIELSRKNCRTDFDKTEENLSNAIEIAQKGLQELRRSVRGLVPETEKINLLDSIGSVVESAKKSELEVDFFVSGEELLEKHPAFLSSAHLCTAIRMICQEAITNSLRHGRAKKVNIMLRFTPDKLCLFIIDDGKGCQHIQKGIGLTGIEGRVKSLNGVTIFGSDGETGFNIRIEIPIERGFS